MHDGVGTTEDYMTNIITAVRKAVAPIKTTSRALGIFSKALAALEEVQENQRKRVDGNDIELRHNRGIIEGLYQKNEALVDDNANALLEAEAAGLAIQQINKLLSPAAVAA